MPGKSNCKKLPCLRLGFYSTPSIAKKKLKVKRKKGYCDCDWPKSIFCRNVIISLVQKIQYLLILEDLYTVASYPGDSPTIGGDRNKEIKVLYH